MSPSIVETRRKESAMYVDFFTLFVAPVVGKKKCENNCWREKLSSFVTVSDEALALLLFDNNYLRWLDMGKNDDWTKSTVRPKYTTGGNAFQTPKPLKVTSSKKKSKGVNGNSETHMNKIDECRESTCAKYQGWSLEGIRRYNIFFDQVKEERKTDHGKSFEEALLKYSMECKDNCKKTSRKDVAVYESCRHELWNTEATLDVGRVCEKDVGAVSSNSIVFNSEDVKMKGSGSMLNAKTNAGFHVAV